MKTITVFEDSEEFQRFANNLSSRINKGEISLDDAYIELEDMGFKLDDIDVGYVDYAYPYGSEGYFIHFEPERGGDGTATRVSWGSLDDGLLGGVVDIRV